MYRHLLLPLDDSPLATETARKGVEFARALGARITFFHAQEDYASTSVGALQRVIAPAEFEDAVAGEARAILAKAEVVAREAGVPYDSLAMISNRPYEAILEAAEQRRCDVIFIASHGRRGIRGLMLGSQTQKVLQHATIPVLVSAVESNFRPGALITPLTVIGDEHRSMAAVLHGLEFLVGDARMQGTLPSFPLLRAMLHYFKEFPQKLHHPKEEAYLFCKLRERTTELDAVLDELERQHVAGDHLIEELERRIARYESDPAGGFEAFARAVDLFASTQMEHMRLETKLILPAARRCLTQDDWAEIDRAFAANGDPRFSMDNDEKFRALFARILNLAPEQVVGAADRA